jgi:hypothetical protein
MQLLLQAVQALYWDQCPTKQDMHQLPVADGRLRASMATACPATDCVWLHSLQAPSAVATSNVVTTRCWCTHVPVAVDACW